MNKTSISFAMAKFIFVSYLALALVTTFIVVNQAVNSVNEQQQAFIALEMQTINDNYRLFLNNHLTILSEQSQQPIIVQALMQNNDNPQILAEYLQHLLFLGKQYDHSLLDFDGQLVYSTHQNPAFFHNDAPWLQSVLTQAPQDHIMIKKIEDRYYWILAAPVKYNNRVEGILTTTIPLDMINQQYHFSDAQQGLAIALILNQQTIASFGHTKSGIVRQITWPSIGLIINFTFDDTAINLAINELIIQLTLLILFSILIITLLAYYLGYRYIVTPILDLARATNSLEDGDKLITLKADIKIKELSNLFNNFNQMSQKISKREQALISSRQKLIKSHENLKQSESQRMQSEKMASLGVLVSGVAHEINNPIGFVKSNVDTLKSYWLDIQDLLSQLQSDMTTPAQQKQLQQLYEKYDIAFLISDINPLIDSTTLGITRVTEIIQSLKSFARADAPQKVMADLNEGLSATIVMARNELKYHCKLDIDLAPLPSVLMHPSKLNQVFMNLLINAGQSIEKEGIISIKTFVKDEDVVIKIADSGCGIAPEKLDQIFTPFYTSKPIGQGTGLGLSISHRIVAQHNGTIKVTSTVGKGSCFTITIPIEHTNESVQLINQ